MIYSDVSVWSRCLALVVIFAHLQSLDIAIKQLKYLLLPCSHLICNNGQGGLYDKYQNCLQFTTVDTPATTISELEQSDISGSVVCRMMHC